LVDPFLLGIIFEKLIIKLVINARRI